MSDTLGTPLAAEQAWQKMQAWQSARREIGVIYYGRCGSLYALGTVEAAQHGRIQLKGATAHLTFNLNTASFTYGPVQTWPRWPSPPIVELMAIQAHLEGGEYLALAEGLRPEALPPRSLPA